MSKTRQWLALGGAALLAVLSLGWFLVISPTRGEAAELSAQAEEQAAQTAVLTSKLQVLRAQAAELPTQQARLAALQEQLPDTVALPDLIRLLTAAAEDTGVTIASMAPSPAVAAGEIAEVPFTLVVDGGYFNLQQFLGALEGLPRAFVVGDFSLGPEGEDAADLQLTLNGKVFTRQLPVDPAAGAAAPAADGTDAAGTAAPETAGAGSAPASEAEVVQPAPATA